MSFLLALTITSLCCVVGAAPIDFLGCEDRKGPAQNMMLVAAENSSYSCRFGWRFSADASAVSVQLTNYRVADLTIEADNRHIRKVAHKQEESLAKLIRLPATDNSQFTWFNVQFNYTKCVGNGEDVLLKIAPIGDSNWEPVVTNLQQSATLCESKYNWFHFSSSDAAPVVDITTTFLVVYVLIVLCFACIGCMYFNPHMGN